MSFRARAKTLLKMGDGLVETNPRNEEALLALLEGALRHEWILGHAAGASDLAQKLTREGEPLRFRYRNWRGEVRERSVRPICIWWGSTEHHPRDQWFLRAVDLEKGEERDFAMSGVLGEPQPVPEAPKPQEWSQSADVLIIGPSGSGKTVLGVALRRLGFVGSVVEQLPDGRGTLVNGAPVDVPVCLRAGVVVVRILPEEAIVRVTRGGNVKTTAFYGPSWERLVAARVMELLSAE